MAKLHIVEQGECLSAIAKSYGFSDWRIIYDHPDNAEFKKLRPDPNILYPGDRLIVPDKSLKEAGCPTEKQHVFKVRKPDAVLRLVIIEQGERLKNTRYELEFEGKKIEGKTDSEGKLEAKLPVETRRVEIKIGD